MSDFLTRARSRASMRSRTSSAKCATRCCRRSATLRPSRSTMPQIKAWYRRAPGRLPDARVGAICNTRSCRWMRSPPRSRSGPRSCRPTTTRTRPLQREREAPRAPHPDCDRRTQGSPRRDAAALAQGAAGAGAAQGGKDFGDAGQASTRPIRPRRRRAAIWAGPSTAPTCRPFADALFRMQPGRSAIRSRRSSATTSSGSTRSGPAHVLTLDRGAHARSKPITAASRHRSCSVIARSSCSRSSRTARTDLERAGSAVRSADRRGARNSRARAAAPARWQTRTGAGGIQ